MQICENRHYRHTRCFLNRRGLQQFCDNIHLGVKITAIGKAQFCNILYRPQSTPVVPKLFTATYPFRHLTSSHVPPTTAHTKNLSVSPPTTITAHAHTRTHTHQKSLISILFYFSPNGSILTSIFSVFTHTRVFLKTQTFSCRLHTNRVFPPKNAAL